MGLARQSGDSPASDHTLSSATPGDGDGVNHLIGGEDLVDRNLLLEQIVGEVHLCSSVSTVDLHKT